MTVTDSSSGFLKTDATGLIATTTIGVADLTAEDFGPFTCDGTTCTFDTGIVGTTTPFTAGYIPLATSTTNLVDSKLFQSNGNIGVNTTTPSHMFTIYGGNMSFSTGTDSYIYFNAAADYLLWDDGGDAFFFSNDVTTNDLITSGSSTTAVLNVTGAKSGFLKTDGDGVVATTTIGVVDLTSEDFGDFTCDGSTCEIDADAITHADILDTDQADTKCVYIEDPTADDDLQSLWANKTANDFTITEVWCESDQTIDFDLQVDDGTPADVIGSDLQCAAGEAENTSPAGDTELAAGEELDLVVTSVSGTPTWVSICWTGNWKD